MEAGAAIRGAWSAVNLRWHNKRIRHLPHERGQQTAGEERHAGNRNNGKGDRRARYRASTSPRHYISAIRPSRARKQPSTDRRPRSAAVALPFEAKHGERCDSSVYQAGPDVWRVPPEALAASGGNPSDIGARGRRPEFQASVHITHGQGKRHEPIARVVPVCFPPIDAANGFVGYCAIRRLWPIRFVSGIRHHATFETRGKFEFAFAHTEFAHVVGWPDRDALSRLLRPGDGHRDHLESLILRRPAEWSAALFAVDLIAYPLVGINYDFAVIQVLASRTV